MPDLAHQTGLPAATHTHRKIPGARNPTAVTGVIASLAAVAGLAACGLLLPHQARAPAVRTTCGTRAPSTTTPSVSALLPVSPAGLAAATGLATRFAAAYASYGYDQTPGRYLARLRPLTTATLYPVLASAAQAPGLEEQRTRERLTASGRAQPEQIRDIEPGSVTTVVRVYQTIDSVFGRTQSATDYAITVITQGNGWKVYDIEPAAAGNQGGGA
jgi:hypothetical protein